MRLDPHAMDEIVLRNRYRVLRRLGAGGVGSVYMVEELRRSAGNHLALKAVFGGETQASLLGSLRQEFRVLANLRHPLLARVYDFGSIPASSRLPGSDGRPGYFFTRELIEGQDLEAHCRGRSVVEICRLCRDTAEVLDALHRAGMVHGDFKPANVIVSPDSKPHLIDFGLVLREGQDSLPSGTAAYLAPEILRGRAADRRVDLYALGISIYQLVTGELPVPRGDLGELIGWHLEGEPLRLSSRCQVPEQLDELVHRLTQRDPGRRYPSAGEVALVLAEASKASEWEGVRAKRGGHHCGEAASGRGERAVEGAVAGTSGGATPITPVRPLFVPPAPGENLSEPLAELERAALGRALRRTDEGACEERSDTQPAPALIALEGEPGSGKSTLLQELAWRSQLAGIEVIRGEFRAGDRRALGVWSDLLAEISGLVATPHPLAELAPGEIDRYALYEQISNYLSASSARTPLLLLLDGAEQADEESRAALRFISHMLGPGDALLLVVAYRSDDELHHELDPPRRVRLRPLSQTDLHRMLADASGRKDEALAARLLAHTGGNPQFVMEVLRRLGEAGWPANPDLRQLAPPRGLEEMYEARWRDLGEGGRALLEALAVLGRPASGRLLHAVLERAHGSAPLVDALPRLEQLEWLDRSPDAQFSFRQGPAASFVYGLLVPERRQRLHLAAAIELEQSGSVDAVERTRHALRADRLEIATRTLPRAVSLLKSLGAHRVAIQIFQDVLRLEKDTARLRGARRELAEFHRLAGEYDRAAQLLELAGEGATGEEWWSSRIALAKVCVAAGQANRALAILEELLASELSAELRLQALSAKTMALAALDAHESLLATALEALRLEKQSAARGRPAAAIRAELQGQAAWSLGHLQRFDEAAGAFAAALEDARAAADPRVEATILNRWAAIAMRQGDHAQVPARYHAALESARRCGDLERAATVRYNLSSYHLWRAEYAASLEHLQESLRLFEAMGLQQSAASARCNLGLLELKLGLQERARADLADALEAMQRLGRRSGEALAMAGLALVNGRRGKLEEARKGIDGARRIYLEVGQQRDAADALLDLAEVELEAGLHDRAHEAIDRVRREIDLEKTLDLKVRAATLQARLAAAGGGVVEQVAGAKAIEQALLAARQLGSPELSFESAAAAQELCAALGQKELCMQHARAAAEMLEQMARGLSPECRAAFWQNPRRLSIQELATSPREESMREQGREPRGGGVHATVTPASHFHPSEASMLGVTLPTVIDDRMPLVEERFYRLLEIYRQINSELDRERLLGLVMDTAVELTGAERGFLLLGGTSAELQVEVARNLEVSEQVSSYSRSIAERVFSSGQPIVTVSARNDPRFKEYLSVHELQLESVLCIPIHARGRVAGVLYMESRFQTGRFTPADQRLLMAFGDQVAIALTNARLMAENLHKNLELERAKREIEALAEERGRMLRLRTEELEEVQRDLADAKRRLEPRSGLFGMVGRSPAMLRLFELMERVAATDVPILVEGESGTGKEMVARGIHNQSQRRKARLVSVNCAAIPESLLESELFGHVRGAFTGADRERKGLFAAAHGGTLFLDEIGDMPTRMQVDLLRALQEKTIRPVGAQEDIKVDVRVIAASNRPLPQLIQEGKFREDLYYRLNVVTLRLPPLRERPDDIPLLTDHFLSVIASQIKTEKKKITRSALKRLREYRWPGNVRQLEHALMNAAVLADRDFLDEGDFILEAPTARSSHPPPDNQLASLPSSDEDRQARERHRMLEVLESCNWNKSRAAELMGMPRRTFYRRLKLYAIQ